MKITRGGDPRRIRDASSLSSSVAYLYAQNDDEEGIQTNETITRRSISSSARPLSSQERRRRNEKGRQDNNDDVENETMSTMLWRLRKK